jgi:endonuclease/exonuclease/phosphatase family metal-dependent hydrolase
MRSYSSGVPVLIRSWNLFHGNTCPPSQTTYLEEMARLASADGPDVLLLQEIPAWALERLGEWTGMNSIGDVAQRPVLGPFPITAGLGRTLTSLRPGLLRSAFSGQGNAILLGAGLVPLSHEAVVLNPPAFRKEEGHRLGLDLVLRLAWAKERRVCQIVRLDGGMLVANLHASSCGGDRRIAAAEVGRAEAAVLAQAADGDTVVIGGDFNVVGDEAGLEGFSAPGPWIDHILVRGAHASPQRTWPDEQRSRGGMLLSDHAPIEVEI